MNDAVESVIDDVRWTYHTHHPQHDPVYIGRLPGWRFTKLLGDSEEVDRESSWYNAGTGHGSKHTPHIEWEEVDPPVAAEDYLDDAPDSTEPHLTAIIADGQLRYRTRPVTWKWEDDDPIKHNEQRWYRGILKSAPEDIEENGDRPWPSQGDVTRWRDEYFVPSNGYSLVDYRQITDETGTVGTMLGNVKNVQGFFSSSLVPDSTTSHTWENGEAAARYWKEYITDALEVRSADATLRETRDKLRYTIRVDGKLIYKNGPAIAEFRATTPRTDAQREHFLDVLEH